MRTYIVRPGDTFGGIAWKQGVSVATLKGLNPQIKNINWIFVGQVIYLPKLAAPIPVPVVPKPVVTQPVPMPPVIPGFSGIMPSQLMAMIPTMTSLRAGELVGPLNQTMQEFLINTPARRAAFLAQCAHESGGFRSLIENLNYSAQGLMTTWPQRFPFQIAALYARQPEKIANRAYGNRLGNGDEASGDGWRYRGRGVIQLTGKNNYQACGAALKLDLVKSPELVEQLLHACRTAGWFWSSRNLNVLADAGDFVGITKGINGGLNGLEDRKRYWAAAKKVAGIV